MMGGRLLQMKKKSRQAPGGWCAVSGTAMSMRAPLWPVDAWHRCGDVDACFIIVANHLRRTVSDVASESEWKVERKESWTPGVVSIRGRKSAGRNRSRSGGSDARPHISDPRLFGSKGHWLILGGRHPHGCSRRRSGICGRQPSLRRCPTIQGEQPPLKMTRSLLPRSNSMRSLWSSRDNTYHGF